MKLIYQKDKRSYRALRGGGWRGYAQYCRSAFRYGYSPGARYGFLGLRPARSMKGIEE